MDDHGVTGPRADGVAQVERRNVELRDKRLADAVRLRQHPHLEQRQRWRSPLRPADERYAKVGADFKQPVHDDEFRDADAE